MQTWSLFTPSDAFYVVMAAAGFSAVVAVLFTSFRNVNRREVTLKEANSENRPSQDS